MSAPSDPALEEAFRRDFPLLLDAAPVEGRMRPVRCWFIMSALQLALRHPEFPESIREPVESFARQLQAIVSITPALATVAAQGWDRAHDVPLASGDAPRADEAGG